MAMFHKFHIFCNPIPSRASLLSSLMSAWRWNSSKKTRISTSKLRWWALDFVKTYDLMYFPLSYALKTTGFNVENCSYCGNILSLSSSWEFLANFTVFISIFGLAQLGYVVENRARMESLLEGKMTMKSFMCIFWKYSSGCRLCNRRQERDLSPWR